MKLTDRLVYVNELNQEIEFSAFSPYVLRGIDENLNNSIITSKQVGRDGKTYASSTLDERDIKIRASIVVRHNIEVLEKRLIRTFNPKLRGKLVYKSEFDEKEIAVMIDSLPQLKYDGGVANVSIDLVAHTPYWTQKEKTEWLALLSGKLVFPLVIPQNTGMMFGLRQSILETEIENVGDVATGFRVVFKAKGIVSNPEVENKLTGEKIKVNVDMEKGDILEIINTPNRKMINVNGVKSFKKLDRNNANFFELEVGRNLIGYNAEVNAINMDVILYYSPLYLGR